MILRYEASSRVHLPACAEEIAMPFMEVGDIVTHYRLDGEGAATVVFVNSLGADLGIWDDVLPPLQDPKRSARFVRYDLRGHGLSESTPPPYSLPALANDLAGLMKALGVLKAVVCGVSLGGLVALQMAVSHPERVSGLILCDALAKFGDAPFWKERLAAVRSKGIAFIADGVLARWFTPSFRSTRPADVRGWRTMLLRTSSEGYLGACTAIRDADLRKDTGSARVPTLVLCGSEDEVTTPGQVRALAESIPDARFELVAGAGHLPCIEKPHALAQSIRAFLEDKRLV